MATLIFVMKSETGMKLSQDAGCAFVGGPGGIPGLIAHLEAGRDVVTLMSGAATGFRIPEGVKIAFHPECPKEGPLRQQCEARAFRAEVSQVSEKDQKPSLLYVERASRALALADKIGAACVVHPADIGKVHDVIASGGTVVLPIEMSREDFRIPRGCGIFFDPVLEKDPRRSRAGIHAMLCGATSVSAQEHARLTEVIAELDRDRIVFGVFAPTFDRSEEPDPA